MIFWCVIFLLWGHTFSYGAGDSGPLKENGDDLPWYEMSGNQTFHYAERLSPPLEKEMPDCHHQEAWNAYHGVGKFQGQSVQERQTHLEEMEIQDQVSGSLLNLVNTLLNMLISKAA